MNKSAIAILILVAALLGSNAWWLYRAVDAAVTSKYQTMSHQDHREALTQALAILPVVARSDSKREEVLSAAANAAQDHDTFEKEGYVWVGRLGLRFNEQGRLVEAVTAWSPF